VAQQGTVPVLFPPLPLPHTQQILPDGSPSSGVPHHWLGSGFAPGFPLTLPSPADLLNALNKGPSSVRGLYSSTGLFGRGSPPPARTYSCSTGFSWRGSPPPLDPIGATSVCVVVPVYGLGHRPQTRVAPVAQVLTWAACPRDWSTCVAFACEVVSLWGRDVVQAWVTPVDQTME